MNETLAAPAGALGAGILLVRLVLGLGIAAHGAQKLFGWFGGHGGLRGTGGMFEMLGLRPGVFFAGLAGFGEFGGGVLAALGLLGPVGPALVVATMVVAMRVAHRGKGFFVSGGGVELPLVYAAGFAGLAFTGHGAYTVDRLLGLEGAWTPAIAWIALVVAVGAGFLIVLLRRRPDTAPAGPAGGGGAA
jgi:putative oxidoreductase